MKLEELERCSRGELVTLLKGGRPLPLEALDDTVFFGRTLASIGIVEKLTWKTFRKVVLNERSERRGWNVRLVQGTAPSDAQGALPMVDEKGVARAFGPFRVELGPNGGAWLDYGVPGNRGLAARVKDPLVDVGDGFVLGVSELHVLGTTFLTPSWFCLRAERPVKPEDVWRALA